MDTQSQKLSPKTPVDCAQCTLARLDAKSQDCNLGLVPSFDSVGKQRNTATALSSVIACPEVDSAKLTLDTTTTTTDTTIGSLQHCIAPRLNTHIISLGELSQATNPLNIGQREGNISEHTASGAGAVINSVNATASKQGLSRMVCLSKVKRWSQVGMIALGLGCMSLVAGCSDQEQAQTSYKPSLAEAVFEVDTIHPQFKNRERSFMLNGRVRAYTRADVRPQVDGIILQRLFTEGTHVDEGTPLYEIDPAPFQAALEHAQASYDRAVVQRKMAAKDFERFDQLYKRRSASEKERDDALLAYELAQADEKLYKAALDTAQISLNYTKVSAPISGIIGVSSVTRGALVNANQSAPLATIIDLDKVYVDLEQSALEWRKLQEGLLTGNIYLNDQAYDVSLYYQDAALYPHLGKLSLSEVIVDEVTGAVALRAEFDNPEHLLLPGMAVMCKLNGGVAQNIMTLPTQSVMRDPKGNAYVYTVQGDRAIQTPVKLGELYNDGWQILEGLDSTYEVIIAGVASLNHGSKIKVVSQDGVDLTVDVATSGQVKDTDAAVKAVNNPNVSSSGLGQSSANVPNM